MPDDETRTPETEHEDAHTQADAEPVTGPGNDATPETEGDYRRALDRLREALIATDATIDPALVDGETVAELDASFARARAAAEHTARTVRAGEGASIGAAAPGRAPLPPRSAFEKIRDGLQPRS